MKRAARAMGISYEVPPTPVYPARELYKAIPNREFEVFKKNVDSTLTTIPIVTATYPCTIVHYKIEMTAHCNDNSVLGNHVFWALLLVKDGYNANTPNIADTNDFYKPEQNVVTWGCVKCFGWGAAGAYPANDVKRITRSEKVNLRLQAGDTLQMIAMGDEATNAATVDLEGACEYIQVTAHQ